MVESNAVPAGSSDREIVLTRTYDAPRDLVFEAWSDPVHLARWWGPNGFSITTRSFEFAAGGKWRFVMHGPDGKDYPNLIVYQEIVRDERIVYAHHDDAKGGPPDFFTTVTFVSEGEKTKVTMRGVFPTAAAREYVVREFGAIEGGKQHLTRLGEHVGVLRAVPKLRITRVLDASRALVFEAWANPAHLCKWFAPDGTSMVDCDIDVRPGGNFVFTFLTPDGTRHPFVGAFREVVPQERIVFAGNVHEGLDVLTTVRFTEQDGKTTLHVEQSFTADSPASRGAPIGWGQTLDHLEAFVARS